jgi:hypothetical protein
MNGWAVPSGPSRSRQWHYFAPDTALFPRWRSTCGVHLLFGEPHLVETIGATRTPLCPRCAQSQIVTAARANPAGDAISDESPSGITTRAAALSLEDADGPTG